MLCLKMSSLLLAQDFQVRLVNSVNVCVQICIGLCGGADVPGMPVESLMTIKGIHNDPGDIAINMNCGVGDHVIVASKSAFGFSLGLLIDIDESDQTAIIEWWVPEMNKESNMKAGRKKLVLDIFGTWCPVSESNMPASDLGALPPSILKSDKILLWGFEMEEDNKLPFLVLDRIMDEMKVDVTGLMRSSTARGNLFRAHRLMKS